MAGSISSLGVGSGLQLESLVQSLIAAESRPIILLENRRTDINLRISALGQVQNSLSEFQSSLEAISTPEAFRGVNAVSGDSEVVTASASQDAVPGVTDITITQLAQRNRQATQGFVTESEAIGTGQLSFTVAGDTFTVDITSEANTLADIRNAINNENDNTSVQASIINVDGGSRLVLTATESGLANQISFSVTDDDANNTDDAGLSRLAFNLQEVDPPLDALFEVDGFAVTRPSNQITDVIQGVTFDLVATGTTTVSVAENLNAATNSVNAFVSAYNSLSATLAVQRGGTLSSENALLSVETGIRNLFSQTFNDSSAQIRFLFEAGLSFDDEGVLSFDQEQFEQAISTDFVDIQNLFANADNGFITQLDDLVDSFTQAGGVLSTRTDGLNAEQQGIDDDIVAIERRLELTEARIRSQFTSLDVLISQLNTTSSFLAQQLANLPSPANNSN